MIKYIALILSLLLFYSETTAQIRIRIDLNVANCTAHSVSIVSVNNLDNTIEKMVVLNRSDSAVSQQILNRFGVIKNASIILAYETSDQRSSSLINGTFSRVRIYNGTETLFDFNLDNLAQYVSLINTLKPRTPKYHAFRLAEQPGYSSSARYSANFDNYWIMDGLLGKAYSIPIPLDSGFIVPSEFQVDQKTYTKLTSLIKRNPVDSFYTFDSAELISFKGVQPASRKGNVLNVTAQLRVAFDNNDTLRKANYDLQSVIFTLENDSIEYCKPVAKSDTSAKIFSDIGSTGYSETGDSLIGQVIRWGAAEHHPLFAFYDPSGPEISQSTYPNFEYPKILWDNDFQYQFTNGSFSENVFAFATFPLAVTTNDWVLHDLSSDLGVSMDSALAMVRFHYHCKQAFSEGGITSLLYYAQGKLTVARFTTRDLLFIDNTIIDFATFDPISAVLAGHDRLVAINQERDKLVSITLD